MEVIGRIIVAMQHHSERLVLVLDDYQMVGSREIHESITLSCSATCRSRCTWSLYRGRNRLLHWQSFAAMGEVSELHAHSLKFSP